MMKPPSHLRLLALALAAGAACAHAPPHARTPRAEVVWPAPPAAPRVRLAALIPDPEAPRPRRSFWRVVRDAVLGTEEEDARPGGLARPFGVAVGADGTLFVADPEGPAVVRVDARGVFPVTCRSRAWVAPMAIAIASDGVMFVADAGAAEVVAVTPEGCRVLGAKAFERPTGLAVSGDRIAVVDPPRHRIVLLSRTGEALESWGTQGSGDGELYFPTGIASAPGGGFLVVDALNFRVVRVSEAGRWVGSFGAPGESGGGFARPKAVAVDRRGDVYVSDAQRDVVLVYDPGGGFQYAIGASGDAPGALALPAGVAVSAGKLYVADSQNHRIQVFDLLGGDR